MSHSLLIESWTWVTELGYFAYLGAGTYRPVLPLCYKEKPQSWPWKKNRK